MGLLFPGKSFGLQFQVRLLGLFSKDAATTSSFLHHPIAYMRMLYRRYGQIASFVKGSKVEEPSGKVGELSHTPKRQHGNQSSEHAGEEPLKPVTKFLNAVDCEEFERKL